LLLLRSFLLTSILQIQAIKNINIPIFVKTISEILSKIGIEAMLHGNVNAEDAKRAQSEITSRLSTSQGTGLPRKKYPAQLVMRIPPSSHSLKCLAKDPTDPNTAVELYFQVGKDNTKDRIMIDLLMEMMYEPLWDQVRTKDQFGYHVSCDSRWTNGVMGMYFHVVTSCKSAQDTEDRLDKFIGDFRQILVDMKPSDFVHHLVALAKQKLEMFSSLGEETDHYWSEIRDGRYLWSVEREEVVYLRSFTKEDVLKAYDEWLAPESKTRRRLAIQVISSEGDASVGRPEIEKDINVSAFNDQCIKEFHSKHCKNQTFGRIY
jgi:nardilysin